MSYIVVSQRSLVGISGLLFVVSAALTAVWCSSMSAMHGMPMPGGWTLSMMWMRMPGQTWPGVAAAFLGMWTVMMVAMMLPSLVPMLWRYRQRVGTVGMHLDALTLLVGGGYFFVWTGFGALAFLIGVILAEFEMQWSPLAHAAPLMTGAIVLIAGTLQFSGWKTHHLACCRGIPAHCETPSADTRAAWRYGLHLGMHCVHCCFGLTIVLLAIGMMDLYAMALVTAAISAERLAPGGVRAARWIGIALVASGLFLIARAALA